MYEKEVKESQLRLQNMQTAGKDAQSDNVNANDEIPIVDTLFKLVDGEALESKIPGKRAVAYYAKDLSLRRVCPQVPVIIEKVETIVDIVTREADDNSNSCPDITSVSNGVLENLKFSLQKCRENVKEEVKSRNPYKRASKVCDDGIAIHRDLDAVEKSINSQNQQTHVSESVSRTHNLQGVAQALGIESSKTQGEPPLGNGSLHLHNKRTVTSSLSVVNMALENARYKTELAKETLKEAKRRQAELRESNEKTMKEMAP